MPRLSDTDQARIYPKAEVFKELGIRSPSTGYRWMKSRIILGPDIEINNRGYYTEARRREDKQRVMAHRKVEVAQ